MVQHLAMYMMRTKKSRPLNTILATTLENQIRRIKPPTNKPLLLVLQYQTQFALIYKLGFYLDLTNQCLVNGALGCNI